MMNGKNNWLMDFVLQNDDLIRSVEFPPKIDRMIAQLKMIAQDFPRQREIAQPSPKALLRWSGS
jgi:hypothetical protein